MRNSNKYKRIIQKADKFSRNKKYLCLVPGCKKRAIQSHAIQKASLIEALADDNGMVYTLQQSFSPGMHMKAANDPLSVVETSVNKASTFNGFCPEHDSMLFAPAESNESRRRGMFISLHLRSLALEYCRKRRSGDFLRKVAELTNDSILKKNLRSYDIMASAFKKVYLGSIFNLMSGSDIDHIEYFCIPFSRNLQVSCCGCFNEKNDRFDSTIGFNLISYADMSILVLTIFKAVEHYLDNFLVTYDLPRNGERLINDIAFSRCEEPLISPKLWLSLNEKEKSEVRLSLRHPSVRERESAVRPVRLTLDDYLTRVTPDILERIACKQKDAIYLMKGEKMPTFHGYPGFHTNMSQEQT